MSAADFGVAAAVSSTLPTEAVRALNEGNRYIFPRATVALKISNCCTDIFCIGVEDDRSDAKRRHDAIVSLHGVISTLGQTMIDCGDRVAAAGVLADAVKEINKHITASRAELSAFDK